MTGILKICALSWIIFLIFLIPANGQPSQQEIEEDEFISLEEINSDEFEAFEEDSNFSDEFDEFTMLEESSSCQHTCSGGGCSRKSSNEQLWWVIAALLATIMAGFLVRYNQTRNLRGIFLLVSLALLGFYKGGCPCPVMSLHHVVFAVIGEAPNWKGMIWFLGLIPVTYIFGRVWCGWICHLGALQELIYLPGKIKLFQSEKAQKIMRAIRIVLFVALIVQIVITRTNLFKTIDPFKVVFNLRASNLTGWILLGLLLVSSVFIYRPFCKTICPIGLILGWISKIPGASILAPKKECVGCKVCDTSCKINAIINDGKTSKLDNQECIVCGNCASDCKKGAMAFTRNIGTFSSKAVCKRN